MEPEKFLMFFKTVGFPVAIATWFLWKIQAFMDASVQHQATMIELMRQLVALH